VTAPRQPSPDVPSQPAFEVLFVCTGNICRSAFAERLARQLMLDRLGPPAMDAFVFSSAGVRATPGARLHPETRMALAVWGIEVPSAGPGAFAARRLDDAAIVRADLVLTAEESHRAAIAWLIADALPKVYGLRRFARMLRLIDQRRLPADPGRRALQIMEWAPRIHADLLPVPPANDIVPDPIAGTTAEHLHAADLVADAVMTFIDVVAPTVPVRW
jgi:protein-tyrosine phosphatase